MDKKRKKGKIYSAITSLVAIGLSCLMCAGILSVSANATKIGAMFENRTPADLWEVGRGITAEANVDAPTYGTQGLYVDGYKDGKRLLKYRAYESNPEYLKSGVKITSTSEREVAEFRNVIDVEGNVKEENLITLQPLSSAPTKRTDFNGLKVYLRDAENEDIYICIDIYVYADTGITMFTVSTSDGAKGAYQYGIYHENFRNFYECSEKYFYAGYYLGGVTHLTKWVPEWQYVFEDESRHIDGGVPQNQMYIKPIALSYDEEDKSVWLNGGKQCLFDLDDTENIVAGKRFKGFTSNKIKISLLTYDIMGENAQYMLYSVDGQGMNGREVLDSTSPYFVNELPKDNLPLAGVDKAYKIFDIQAYDLVDGTISPVAYVKYQTDGDETFTLVEGDSFTPTKKGNYVLRYVAKDICENERVLDYSIEANYALPEVNVTVDSFETECNVGDRVYLPAWSASGGSGTLEKKVEIIRLADQAVIEQQEGYFIPLVAGEYIINFTATDYIGNSCTVVEKCTATLSNVPVLEKEFMMYPKMISGVKIELPKVFAYDYSLVGQKVNAETKITVSGYGEYASVSEEVDNYQFTPTVKKFGDKIKITYRIFKVRDSVNYLEKCYENIPLIEPENSWDYLEFDQTVLDLAYNSASDKERFLKFTATQAGDHSIEMINPVKLEYFELEVNATQGADKYDSLQLYLTDANDVTNYAVITLKDRVGDYGTIVEYNGQTAIAVNKFVSNERFVLMVKNGVLLDSLGNSLIAFSRFSPKQVRVALVMKDAQVGGEIILKKISTTYFSASYRKGELTTFKDYVSPEIVLEGKIRAEESYDSYVKVPSAKAYDDLSPCLSTNVSVKAPNGEILFDNVLADKTLGFVANLYGKYEITYTATDASKNTTVINQEIQINDYNAPIFDYNGKVEYKAKVGDKISLKKFDVYDGVDENPTYFIFVITPDGILNDVTDLKNYKFESAGIYIVRHCVYDTSYNYCLLDVTFEVI